MKDVYTTLRSYDLIARAVMLHRKRNDGKDPRRIELHPVVVDQILFHNPYLLNTLVAPTKFMGIPLKIDKQFVYARLVTWTGSVEYI